MTSGDVGLLASVLALCWAMALGAGRLPPWAAIVALGAALALLGGCPGGRP